MSTKVDIEPQAADGIRVVACKGGALIAIELLDDRNQVFASAMLTSEQFDEMVRSGHDVRATLARGGLAAIPAAGRA